MSISNYPFTITRPGDVPRPYLPITLVNPNKAKQLKVIAFKEDVFSEVSCSLD
jgi:hypothetical protein